MTKSITIVFSVLASPVVGNQAGAWHSGDTLLDYCKSTNPIAQAICSGYIVCIYDGSNAHGILSNFYGEEHCGVYSLTTAIPTPVSGKMHSIIPILG